MAAAILQADINWLRRGISVYLTTYALYTRALACALAQEAAMIFIVVSM